MELGPILGIRKNRLANKPDNRLVLPTTFLGLELEFERAIYEDELPQNIQTYWKYKRDDSLHDNGAEYVFIEPMYGQDVISALNAILPFAEHQGWKSTLRTGIHVHMDSRDLHLSQLRGLLIYYAMLEPAIYHWVGEGRDANNFCAPWYKCEGSIIDAANILFSFQNYAVQDTFSPTLKNLCNNFHKYAGCNLRALATFGSIEFRHLKTTTNIQQVIDWINIVLSLKRAALAVPESSMVIVNEAMRAGFSQTLVNVFGSIGTTMISEQVIKDIRELGVPNAIDLAVLAMEQQNFIEVTKNGKTHEGLLKWMERKNEKKELNPEKEKPPPDLDFDNSTIRRWFNIQPTQTDADQVRIWTDEYLNAFRPRPRR